MGLAALVGVGSTAPSIAADPFERIELEQGEQRAYEVADGETFENVLIDQTADGSMFSIRVEEGANDWAIRNVGWKGVAPSGGAREYTFLMHVRGNGRIENVFIDQRNHDGGVGSDVGGIWTYSDSHHGHVECRHNFIAGCGNNASYQSGDGWAHKEATGTIEHVRSYHRDNTVSNFRPGTPGSTVRECVSVLNDPEGTRGGYPSTGSQMSRAIWGWHHRKLRMENCAVWHDPDDVQPAIPFWATLRDSSEGSACELTVTDSAINESWEAAGNPLQRGDESGSRIVTFEGLGTGPSVEVLGDGVPTTPEMAAAGERTLPPELGTAPGGGVGEFEVESSANSANETASAVNVGDDNGSSVGNAANGSSVGNEATSSPTPQRVQTSTSNREGESDEERSMLLGSAVGSIGVAGYILRDSFGWDP